MSNFKILTFASDAYNPLGDMECWFNEYTINLAFAPKKAGEILADIKAKLVRMDAAIEMKDYCMCDTSPTTEFTHLLFVRNAYTSDVALYRITASTSKETKS
jgi:hypothetical protein